MENEQVKTMKAPQLPGGVKPAETNKNLLTLSKSEGTKGPCSVELLDFL